MIFGVAVSDKVDVERQEGTNTLRGKSKKHIGCKMNTILPNIFIQKLFTHD